MDDEFAALADAFAAGFDPAAMLVDEPPDQRESNPESALRALERAVDLIEHLEEARQRVLRHADTGILHPYHHTIVLPLGGEPDVAAARGVLRGVVEQVLKDLGEPHRVAVDVHGPG